MLPASRGILHDELVSSRSIGIMLLPRDFSSHSSSRLRFAEAHRHMLDAGEKVRAQPFDLAGDYDLLQARQERLECQAQFEAGEMRAATKMLAPAEGEVVIGRPS